jgi:hypothetical protein
VTTRNRRRALLALAVALAVASAATTTACAPAPADPAAAVLRTTAPPWDAPRDAVSHIDAAGFARLPFGHPVARTVRADLEVRVDDVAVVVPAFIGIDRVRAVEASLHTHADDGELWLESPDADEEVSLGDFFDLWGVRLDAECLGDACGPGGPTVTVDGRLHEGDPRAVVVRDGEAIVLTARR